MLTAQFIPIREPNELSLTVNVSKFELRLEPRKTLCHMGRLSDAAGHPGPSRKVQGHLRVKVDGGEGTLPIPARSGEAPPSPLLTMSCTDKLAK